MNENHYDPEAIASETVFEDDITTVSANYLNSLVPVFAEPRDAVEALAPGELCIIDESMERHGDYTFRNPATNIYIDPVTLDVTSGWNSHEFDVHPTGNFVDMACDGKHLLVLTSDGTNAYVRIHHYTEANVSYDVTLPNILSGLETEMVIDTNGSHWVVAYHADVDDSLHLHISQDFEGGATATDVAIGGGIILERYDAFYLTPSYIVMGLAVGSTDIQMRDLDGILVDTQIAGPYNLRLRACNGRDILMVPESAGAGSRIQIRRMGKNTSQVTGFLGATTTKNDTLSADATGRAVMDASRIHLFMGNGNYHMYEMGNDNLFEVYTESNAVTSPLGGGLCITRETIYTSDNALTTTGFPQVGLYKVLNALDFLNMTYTGPASVNQRALISDGLRLFMYGTPEFGDPEIKVAPMKSRSGLWRRTGGSDVNYMVPSPFHNLPLVPC
jgi:hypothetical protein